MTEGKVYALGTSETKARRSGGVHGIDWIWDDEKWIDFAPSKPKKVPVQKIIPFKPSTKKPPVYKLTAKQRANTKKYWADLEALKKQYHYGEPFKKPVKKRAAKKVASGGTVSNLAKKTLLSDTEYKSLQNDTTSMRTYLDSL